jgi:hypothetical protein
MASTRFQSVRDSVFKFLFFTFVCLSRRNDANGFLPFRESHNHQSFPDMAKGNASIFAIIVAAIRRD